MQKYFHVKLSSILSLFWKEPSLALAEGNATERYEMRIIVGRSRPLKQSAQVERVLGS